MQSEISCWSRYHSMNDEPEAMRILNAAPQLPALVVFDLDYTLWPFFCECRSKRESPVLYPQAKSVIQALKAKGVLVAVASRSPTPDIARTFLTKLDLLSNFCVMEIYSSWSHKVEHFQKIHQKTGIPYNSMLFFDDEDRNIQAVSQMGVKSILVHDGVNLDALQRGLQKFGAARTGAGGPFTSFLTETEIKALSQTPPKPEPYSLANEQCIMFIIEPPLRKVQKSPMSDAQGFPYHTYTGKGLKGIECGSDGQVRRQTKLTDLWNTGSKGSSKAAKSNKKAYPDNTSEQSS